MIKLFMLKNISAFSSDTMYKICLSLEEYGLTDDNVSTFEDYDELYRALVDSLDRGDDVIVATENSDYNSIKREFIGKLILDEMSSPAIAECIAKHADDSSTIDMSSHCLIPRDSVYHLSDDGLYSGFTCGVLNGSFTYVPLDFSRIDSVLKSFVSLLFENAQAEPESNDYNNYNNYDEAGTYAPENKESRENDFQEPVSKMVYALMQMQKTIALVSSVPTMWIYNLYDRVDGLADVVNFVEVVDDYTPEDDDGSESESARLIRYAKEAMHNATANFGAAVSEIYSMDNDDGTTSYFAYVAIADRRNATAKKINTNSVEDLELLLPHCVMVLCNSICKKIEELNREAMEKNDEPEEKEEKKISKGMIAFAAVIIAVAIITPIILVNHYLKADTTTQSLSPDLSSSSTDNSAFPGINNTTTGGQQQNTTILPADNYKPAEPAATDVTAAPTAAPAPSTSGVFTFYVFGYGHGVGMSQHGANYLANMGWNYAQILANYYYGTTLVTGDTYPATINYSGSDYNTRDYLASALESEMGGSFHKEALKAQAVALYTFAKYNSYKLNAEANAFGKTPSQACLDAVDEVMQYGLYIAYNGATALTPFHSISAGKTTSYYNVWGSTSLDYLAGGRPSQGDYEVTDFKSTFTISSADFKAIAKEKLGVELSGDPSSWISIVSHDQAINDNVGYVSSINVGGKVISGNDFRGKVLGGKIRSHCFMLVYTPDAN